MRSGVSWWRCGVKNETRGQSGRQSVRDRGRASCCRIGDGVPDLLVGRHGRLMLFEIKDGKKPPSARELTEKEREWQKRWDGYPVHTVLSVEQALWLVRD
jgi:hypothetical protein